MESGSVEYFDGYFIDPALFAAIFCIFGELIVVVFLQRLWLDVVVPVAELEDVVVFEGLDGCLLSPGRRFLHHIAAVEVDQFVSLPLASHVLVLLLHLILFISTQ